MKKLEKKPYSAPEITIYGSVPAITGEQSTGNAIDQPGWAGETYGGGFETLS